MMPKPRIRSWRIAYELEKEKLREWQAKHCFYWFIRGATAYEFQWRRLGIRYCHLNGENWRWWSRLAVLWYSPGPEYAGYPSSEIYCASHSEHSGWFRVNDYGLHWTRSEPMFSERNGYVRKWRIPFTRWRVGILRPQKGWIDKGGM